MTSEGQRLGDNQLKPQCETLFNEILDATFCERLAIYLGQENSRLVEIITFDSSM